MKLTLATDNPFAIIALATPLADPNCALPQPTRPAVEANMRNHKKYFLHVSVFAFSISSTFVAGGFDCGLGPWRQPPLHRQRIPDV